MCRALCACRRDSSGLLYMIKHRRCREGTKEKEEKWPMVGFQIVRETSRHIEGEREERERTRG